MGLSHGLGSNLSLEEAEPVLLKAIELGCTFWDTAVRYIFLVNQSGRPSNLTLGVIRWYIAKASMRSSLETLFANTTSVTKSSVSPTHGFCFVFMLLIRVPALVASKCGLTADFKVTNSASHIAEYIDGTIERLGFAPDLYYLHRIDPSMNTHALWLFPC